MRAVGAALAASVLAVQAVALAAPVELDTPDAHIIVTRPVDVWSGDSSAQADSLDHVKSKSAWYWLWLAPKNQVIGGPLLFQPRSSEPMVDAATAEMAKFGFAPGYSQSYGFRVLQPEPLEPTRFEEFSNAQRTVYMSTILSQGDPDTLPGRVSGRKFVGGLLSLMTLGAAGAKFGAIGDDTVLNTGIAGDAYQLPTYQLPLYLRDSLAPSILPAFDAMPFKQIDVRPVVYRGGMGGQILIAYKAEKTDAAELAAMGVAIAAVAGAGTTIEEVQKSRADDLAFRKATWAACVASGDCKDGVYTRQGPATQIPVTKRATPQAAVQQSDSRQDDATNPK